MSWLVLLLAPLRLVSSAFDATVCSLGVFLGRCCFGSANKKRSRPFGAQNKASVG